MVQLLKQGDNVKSAGKTIAAKSQLPEEFNVLKKRLSDFFQAKVQMTCSPKGKGKISIAFDSEEQLEQIMHALDRAKEQ